MHNPSPPPPSDSRPQGQDRFLSRRRLLSSAFIGTVSLTALTGCSSSDALAQQAKAGDNKNYIAGDGSVTEYAPLQRTPRSR